MPYTLPLESPSGRVAMLPIPYGLHGSAVHNGARRAGQWTYMAQRAPPTGLVK